MSWRGLLVVVCLAALAAFVPARARAIDYNISGAAQLDYHFVPQQLASRGSVLDGFTQEISLKLALDLTSHVSANVKVCYGCHGFEMAAGYLDLRLADEFNIRVGRFNPTFGEFQVRYDVANHRTSDKPLPYDMGRMLYLTEFNRSVLPLPYVDTGIEISGNHFFANRVQVDYAVHAEAGLRNDGTNPNDVDFVVMHTAAPYNVDNNSRPSVGGRVGATVRLAERAEFSLGASVLWGPYDNDARLNYLVLGADAFLRVGRTNLRAEYLMRRTDMAVGSQQDFVDTIPLGPNGMLPQSIFMTKDGWYIELEQPLSRRVEAVLRWDGIRRLGNPAMGAPLAFDAGISRVTLGANVLIVRGLRVKASVEHWYVWGVQNAPTQSMSAHLSVVGAF